MSCGIQTARNVFKNLQAREVDLVAENSRIQAELNDANALIEKGKEILTKKENDLIIHVMEKLPSEIKKLLKPEGQFIMVVMPSFCLWETQTDKTHRESSRANACYLLSIFQ